jgi:hypothetical protein
MPLQDLRTKATAQNGKMKTAGRMRVMYRNAAGKTQDAVVVGPGTGSGLKIVIRVPATVAAGASGNQVLDNVPAATTVKQLSAYTARLTQ